MVCSARKVLKNQAANGLEVIFQIVYFVNTESELFGKFFIKVYLSDRANYKVSLIAI